MSVVYLREPEDICPTEFRDEEPMSDTPRVDKFLENFPGSRREPRLIEFAEQLERERAELKKQIFKMRCCENCRYGANMQYNAKLHCNYCHFPNLAEWELEGD
jgi:hypothetical protein